MRTGRRPRDAAYHQRRIPRRDTSDGDIELTSARGRSGSSTEDGYLPSGKREASDSDDGAARAARLLASQPGNWKGGEKLGFDSDGHPIQVFRVGHGKEEKLVAGYRLERRPKQAFYEIQEVDPKNPDERVKRWKVDLPSFPVPRMPNTLAGSASDDGEGVAGPPTAAMAAEVAQDNLPSGSSSSLEHLEKKGIDVYEEIYEQVCKEEIHDDRGWGTKLWDAVMPGRWQSKWRRTLQERKTQMALEIYEEFDADDRLPRDELERAKWLRTKTDLYHTLLLNQATMLMSGTAQLVGIMLKENPGKERDEKMLDAALWTLAVHEGCLTMKAVYKFINKRQNVKRAWAYVDSITQDEGKWRRRLAKAGVGTAGALGIAAGLAAGGPVAMGILAGGAGLAFLKVTKELLINNNHTWDDWFREHPVGSKLDMLVYAGSNALGNIAATATGYSFWGDGAYQWLADKWRSKEEELDTTTGGGGSPPPPPPPDPIPEGRLKAGGLAAAATTREGKEAFCMAAGSTLEEQQQWVVEACCERLEGGQFSMTLGQTAYGATNTTKAIGLMDYVDVPYFSKYVGTSNFDMVQDIAGKVASGGTATDAEREVVLGCMGGVLEMLADYGDGNLSKLETFHVNGLEELFRMLQTVFPKMKIKDIAAACGEACAREEVEALIADAWRFPPTGPVDTDAAQRFVVGSKCVAHENEGVSGVLRDENGMTWEPATTGTKAAVAVSWGAAGVNRTLPNLQTTPIGDFIVNGTQTRFNDAVPGDFAVLQGMKDLVADQLAGNHEWFPTLSDADLNAINGAADPTSAPWSVIFEAWDYVSNHARKDWKGWKSGIPSGDNLYKSAYKFWWLLGDQEVPPECKEI